jgi:hypothetical protein
VASSKKPNGHYYDNTLQEEGKSVPVSEHHIMKMYGPLVVKLHAFLTSAEDMNQIK